MIKVYFRGGCGSSRRAFSWFEKYNINVQKYQISKMTRNNLIKLLQLSDEGLKDIIKRPGKSRSEVRDAITYIELLSFNEALDFILSHPYVFQTPIILEGNNHLIGYNEDEIRKFLPKEYRRHRLLSE
ncbi:ArsC/Spx/MgsR family protein [Lactococcus petauri]|uniref:ArsC/Spx/MgsR family protein n=1 Tax=Lactococcus petauri TaxID=1940789 RepID=A0AAJ2J007_9LACT|nr:ArsC/Spx/MgsR family protein [Lactococcus petauri]MDT2528068.1 ArsC/Spx/MgsR family protein [Lactococcus petauri]MDT2561351.1 ArsC/Spx/MgsR family protein [Lactococcus petauri]MDT2586710.1 ArsC/Spx/MgsR family protein [Lactococcus petauri]MDT2667732.1 ArsC/Spx/MgsR family protein [Lactococcus petauri]